MKNKISNSVRIFLEYSFKGNGKYYLNEQGSQHYRMTSFSRFSAFNADCMTITDRGNDAPRGGYCGNYVIVEFNEKFNEKFGWYFEAKKDAENKAKKDAEKRRLLEKEISEKFKVYCENHPEKVEEWFEELGKISHKKGRLYKENRVARATQEFDFWGKYRIFDEVLMNS